MTERFLQVEFVANDGDGEFLLPAGIATPHTRIDHLHVSGAEILDIVLAEELGLAVCRARANGSAIVIQYRVMASNNECYPETSFAPRLNRFTQASDELAAASVQIAKHAGGGLAGIQALVDEARARFDYAHPEIKFNDGAEVVPYLACGLTPGSCVDINTYLIASLRAADYQAAYLYGYFFPTERGGLTNDMHCWVVTRHEGQILEWDIAHHIKAGLDPIRPALDPKPGERVAVGHSMGHRYRWPDRTVDAKLLSEPMWLDKQQLRRIDGLKIQLIDEQ